MGYNINDLLPFTDDKSGNFLDFALKTGHPIITDYSRIDREIVVKDNMIMLGKYKKKIKITSIDELKKIFLDLIRMIYNIQLNIMDYVWSRHEPIVCSWDSNRKEQLNNLADQHKEMWLLLAHQLVFDVLYDKYLKDSPQLTLNEYCESHIDFNWDSSITKKIAGKKANELGNTPDTYIECIKLALAQIKYKVDDAFDGYGFEKSHFIQKLKTSIEFINVHKADFTNIKTPTEKVEKLNAYKNIIVSIEELAAIEAIMDDSKKLNFEPKHYIDNLLRELVKAKNRSIKALRAEITKEVNIKNNPALKEDAKKFGVNPDKYLERVGTVNDFFKTDWKRYKHEWDFLYYNRYMITARQYDRNFGIDRVKRSYYYGHFVRDFDAYDRFAERLLPKDSDKGYEYFRKSMDFYHLERYKRLDYIYKLAVKMESIGLTDIDREHFLIKRFHPCVFWPLLDNENNCLRYHDKPKYYLPLLFIEESWLKKENFDNQPLFDEYNLVRAKAYELFEYHFNFASEDYDDIENFIRTHYNLSKYHTPKKEWYNPDKRSRNQTMRIQNADIINKALFWDSDKRLPAKWASPNKE